MSVCASVCISVSIRLWGNKVGNYDDSIDTAIRHASKRVLYETVKLL